MKHNTRPSLAQLINSVTAPRHSTSSYRHLAPTFIILMMNSVFEENQATTVVVIPLLLAGGYSTRFGSPKHKAVWTDGRPLYVHMLERIKEAFPDAPEIFMSLRCPSKLNNDLMLDANVKLIYDDDLNLQGGKDIGPAAGLLAAHAARPEAHWLIVACDYPLISTTALLQLCEEYQEPSTCFQNVDGFPEPLLAVWSPLALQHLQDNVAKDILGPSKALKDLQGKTLVPMNERWLKNTNTEAEFQEAISLCRNMHG